MDETRVAPLVPESAAKGGSRTLPDHPDFGGCSSVRHSPLLYSPVRPWRRGGRNILLAVSFGAFPRRESNPRQRCSFSCIRHAVLLFSCSFGHGDQGYGKHFFLAEGGLRTHDPGGLPMEFPMHSPCICSFCFIHQPWRPVFKETPLPVRGPESDFRAGFEPAAAM